MVSLRELKRRRDALKRKDAKSLEKAQLKSEIRQLKYGGALRTAKVIGGYTGKAAISTGKVFKKYAEYYDRNERSSMNQGKKKKKKRNNYPSGYDYGSVF